MAATNLLSFDNEVFSHFAFSVAVVLLKLLLLGMYTSMVRMRKGSFANTEDVTAFYKGSNPDKKKPNREDPDVERVRRNHLNDLENIPAYIFAGTLYILTGPNPWYALWHFRVYAVSRVLHTLSYQAGVQPWRALFHFICFGITTSMLVQVLRVAVF